MYRAIMQAMSDDEKVRIAYTSSVLFDNGFTVPKERKLVVEMIQEWIKRNFTEIRTNKVDTVKFLNIKDNKTDGERL